MRNCIFRPFQIPIKLRVKQKKSPNRGICSPPIASFIIYMTQYHDISRNQISRVSKNGPKMHFFIEFCAGEPIWVPSIFKTKLKTRSKLSGSIARHKYYQIENISRVWNFSIISQGVIKTCKIEWAENIWQVWLEIFHELLK